MLDIQMQIFKCVAEKKSFSLAAQELHMTQSSVSQQIQNLECYYGVKLFDRLHRRIMITQAGAALYPYATELERLYQEANKTMRGLMDDISGRLHIGASMTIGEYLLPEMLVLFSRMYPRVAISMETENTERIISRVISGDVNIGFVEGLYEPIDTLIDTRCGGDQLVIVAPANYKLPTCNGWPIEVIAGERWVLREPNSGTRRVFEQFLNKHGCNASALNVVMELSSTEAIKSSIKAGMGMGALSRLAVAAEVQRGELQLVPLREGKIERSFTMLCHRERFVTSAVEKFAAFIAEKNSTSNSEKIL